MKPSRLAWLALLLLAPCGGSNGPPRQIMAIDFTRTCTKSMDCAPIYEGPITSCTVVPCPNAAIAQSNLAIYNTAVTARLAPCTEQQPSQCMDSAVTCPAGTCEFHRVSFNDTLTPGITATDYPQDCQDVADCLPIFEGPLGCCTIVCPNAAISVAAEAQWQTDVDRRTPVCNMISCRKVPPGAGGSGCHGRVACDNGRCTMLGATDGGVD